MVSAISSPIVSSAVQGPAPGAVQSSEAHKTQTQGQQAPDSVHLSSRALQASQAKMHVDPDHDGD